MQFLVFSAFMLFASFAFSDCSDIRCSGVIVDRIYINDSGRVRIGTSGDEKLLSCTPSGGKYIWIPKSENESLIVSSFMVAQATGRSVMVRVKDTSEYSDCELNYMTLDS